MDNQLLFIVIIILILFFMFNSSTKPVKNQHHPLPMDPYNPPNIGLNSHQQLEREKYHKIYYVVKHGDSYQVVSGNEPVLQVFSPPGLPPIQNYSY
jgi:hypothetical protein